MSTSSQNNGKKSSNSSIANTPASTPITNINGNPVNAQNSPPPNNNAPKYGTLVPNRIFVGGISANTTEGELMQLFSSYGTVKAAKIIQDRAGVSKGYGFITFESEDDAKRPLRDSDNIVLKERKLNIAPAIKKQPFSRAFDASSPPAVAGGAPGAQFFFPPGAAMPYFQGGVAYYPQAGGPGDPAAQQPVYQPPPVYPAQTGPPQAATYPSMMFPTQTIYMPQQYPMPMPYDYNYYQAGGGGGAPPMYAPGAPQQQQPCGPGGGGGGAHSPPRPPCYGGGGSVLYGVGGEPVFYNMPVYGHPALDGAPFYDGLEVGPPAGAYGEDNYATGPLVDTGNVGPPSSDLDHTATTTITTPHHSNNNNSVIYDIAPPSARPPAPPIDHKPMEGASRNNPDTTPVVSLLSIHHQQEKDYTSMQGGRRRKSQPMPAPPPPAPVSYPSNGFIPFHHPHHHFHGPPPNFVPYNGHFNGPMPMTNGFVKKRRPQYGNGNGNNHSSRSSLRTDSNSSASCVDENRNEEKPLRTRVNTPPPPPYSPMANHGQYTRSFRNNRYSRSPERNSRVFNNNNNIVVAKGQEQPDGGAVITRGIFTGGQTYTQPVRRSRRSLRRGTISTGNEIGAGDAPLPAGDDVNKKLETLKL